MATSTSPASASARPAWPPAAPASGRGTVRTFVVFDKPHPPYFAERIPYVVAVVTLEEGPKITTNVIDIDVSAVKIGMPVRIVINTRGEQKIPQASARV
jgi:uncharacterized OB-fold protein